MMRSAAASLLFTMAVGVLSSAAQAQGVAGQISSAGIGADVSYGLHPMFGLRAKLYGGSLSRDFTESGIRYDAKLKFNSITALADFHPFAGGFRLSAGLMANSTKFDLTGKAESGTIEINGVRYNAADVGTVHGRVSFDTSPYLGLGWGTAPTGGTGVFFSSDFGVLFQKTKASLTGACGPSLPAPACTQLQSDLRAEEQQFRDAVDDFKLYPLLSVGVGYRF